MSVTETPGDIHARALDLTEYLLAVRALMEKPSRQVPTADAHWASDFPEHPACVVGPATAGEAWLRVGRPTPPEPPQLPAMLLPYVVWDNSWAITPRLTDQVRISEATSTEFTAWMEKVWQGWSEEATAADATRRLHDKLYDLRYRLDIEIARLELVWGHVILDASIEEERLHYPLLATPVAIEYDPKTTTVTVVPQGSARLQADALSGWDERRVADLMELGGVAGQVEIDPWDETERMAFVQDAMRRLGLDPVIREPGDSAPTVPHVHDTGLLFVRPRQRMVRRYLEKLREQLAADRDPAAVGALADILAHEPSRLVMPDDEQASWERVGGRLLMPMSTNEAQESIARRLATNRNVAVQGPPGTGKTHTIRNLICHLVASGKRVLVLAQKEDPLRVLRDGLPEEIQPLCLAILGRSADQLVQLQIAARELSDKAATLDRKAESAWTSRLIGDIEQAEADLEAANEQLRQAALRESAQFELDGRHISISELGDRLRRTAVDGIIPDEVGVGVAPPLEVAEFALLVELARQISPPDRLAARGALPADGSLPTGEKITARLEKLRDANKVVEALRDQGILIDGVRGLGETKTDELARKLRVAASDLNRREGSWTDRLGRLVREPSWRALWDDNVLACQRLMADLAARTSFLAGRDVVVGAEHLGEPRRTLTQLAEIRERFAEGRKLNRLTQNDLVRLAAECTVDGEGLRSTNDVDLVRATLERAQLRTQLANRWQEWATRLYAPVPTDNAAEPELWAGRLLTEAIDALDWERRKWPQLHGELMSVQPTVSSDVDARMLGQVANTIEACGNVFVADKVESERNSITSWFARVCADPQASPVLHQLRAAWQANDLAAWDQLRGEVARLWTLRDGSMKYLALHTRLAAVAPQWAGIIDSGRSIPIDGAACIRAWTWRQGQTWFDEAVGTADTAALGRSVESCRERIRTLTRDLVVASAWLEVSLSLDDRKKAALADWTTSLRKIGKGTGKTAAHWQAVAQQAMAEAVTAVPVWVMSIDRALEQFKPGKPVFDVVIVDEASQADVFSLPVLALAHRAVVVGDDQQIGPQLVGVPVDRVNALITTHLSGVPSGNQFDAESSLYDHAVRRSPQRILLTEHFRSVPAIIGFSSETYYDGKIQPLRADLPSGLPPVMPVFIAEGERTELPDYGEVNVPEAEALIERVQQIVADPAYENKTIGVVSLLSSSGQADYIQHRLRESVGAQELARRELRVGDAYTFQGDERDVVLISMVVSARDGAIGAFTKRDFHRRVNVAASRARDQMWLFHSVPVTGLGQDDARALLLSHMMRPREEPDDRGDPFIRCESDFQRAVLRQLLDRGLRPQVQFKLGRYKIDFVIPAPDGRRLAVECDSDRFADAAAFGAELRRQTVLERVGNATFVRLRSSIFHRAPEVAMAPVWERANELGIELVAPSTQSAASPS